MLLTIENARKTVPQMWWAISGWSATATVMFMLPFFKDTMGVSYIVAIAGWGAGIGFAMSLYLMYRSKFGGATALFYLGFALLTMEILFTGGL